MHAPSIAWLLTVAAVAQDPAPTDPTPQERFARATQHEERARLALWRAFALHRRFHERLASERTVVSARLAALLGATTSDPNRPAGRDALRTVFAGRLEAEPLAPTVAQALAQALAQVFPQVLRTQRSADEAAAQVLDRLYPADVGYGEVWNGALLSHVPEAQAYRDARDARRRALEALQVAIDPVRRHPAFARTPSDMVLVPGGTYTIGPAKGWALGAAGEARTVPVRSLYVDRHEVTNAQFRAFLGALPARKARPLYPSNWDRPEGDEAPRIPAGKEDHPVTGIDLVAAMAYAEWVGKRLPAEEEWEVAARGVDARTYPWGDAFDRRKTNCRSGLLGVVARVGEHPEDRSPFGVLDLGGNVSEWTVSQVDGKPLRRPPAEGQVLNVMTRGGSAVSDDPEESCAATYRWPQPARGTRRSDLGFRCVQDAPER